MRWIAAYSTRSVFKVEVSFLKWIRSYYRWRLLHVSNANINFKGIKPAIPLNISETQKSRESVAVIVRFPLVEGTFGREMVPGVYFLN